MHLRNFVLGSLLAGATQVIAGATNTSSSTTSIWATARDSSTDQQYVSVSEVETGVWLVNMTDPKTHNTMSPRMMGAIARAIDGLNAKNLSEITTIVLTGAGSSFCAGIDIRDELDDPTFDAYITRDVDPFLAVQQSSIPVIAAVHGAALTGGFEMAVTSDIVIASRDAIFRDNHAMYGVTQLRGLSQIPSRIAGPSNARLASLASYPITGEQALAWHLISQLVDTPEDLIPAALNISRGIAYNNAKTVRYLKRSMVLGYKANYAEAREVELNNDVEYFESLSNKTSVLEEGAIRFAERVKELDQPGGMRGGMLGGN